MNTTNTIKIRNDIIHLPAITAVGLPLGGKTVQVTQGGWMLYYECSSPAKALRLLNQVQREWLKYLEFRRQSFFPRKRITKHQIDKVMAAAFSAAKPTLKK
jgi:hypothetical protein